MRRLLSDGGLLAVAMLIALAFAGCGGDSPTAPAPVLCPLVLAATPVASFPGLYVISVDPPGSYTLSVDGIARSIEPGALVTASAGAVIQGCRPCGCSPAVVVR